MKPGWEAGRELSACRQVMVALLPRVIKGTAMATTGTSEVWDTILLNFRFTAEVFECVSKLAACTASLRDCILRLRRVQSRLLRLVDGSGTKVVARKRMPSTFREALCRQGLPHTAGGCALRRRRMPCPGGRVSATLVFDLMQTWHKLCRVVRTQRVCRDMLETSMFF